MQLRDRACDGKIGTLVAYLVLGFMICIFLGLTVQNRTTSKLYPQDESIIMNWHDQGYFYLGGQRITGNEVKKTYTWFYLTPAFVLQEINIKFRGTYSPRLMAFYNQSVIWLAAVAVGFLAFRVARCLEANERDAFVLGFIALAVYHTFPWNIAGYFRIYPTNFWMIFAPLYMAIVLRELQHLPFTVRPGILWIKAMLMFLMFYQEHVASFFLLLALVALVCFWFPDYLRKSKVVLTIILPALLAFLLFKGALLYLHFRFPDLQFTGSSLLYRSGWDGSTEYYENISALFTRRTYLPSYLNAAGKALPLANWGYLVIATGVSSLVMLWALGSTAKPLLAIEQTLVTVGALALQYIMFALILSQAAITHPFGYDIYIAAPCIILGLVVGPALMARVSPYQRIIVLSVMIIGLAIVMHQMRMFAVAFPLTPDDMWIRL